MIFLTMGGHMFEYDRDIVNFLLNESNDFKRLYDKHGYLKRTVKEANEGNINFDQLSLESLKKEKLLIKDSMSEMIENYRRSH